MPPGTFIPCLTYESVEDAVDWLCSAFGFEERLRIGDHRSQLMLGQSSMVVVGGTPNGDPASGTHSVMVRVADVDRHHRRAAAHGARIISQPTTYPYGERQYEAVDIGEHVWTFSQSVADIDPADWGGTIVGP